MMDAISTAKVGLGVKSEGSLVVSGTKGYVYVNASWWKTKAFEICYEHMEHNEKFFSRFDGGGLRYELSEFISLINGNNKSSYKLAPRKSIAISYIIEKILDEKDNIIKAMDNAP